MSETQRWTLRETLIVTVLGAVFAVLYLAWVQVWLVAQAIFGVAHHGRRHGLLVRRLDRRRGDHPQARCGAYGGSAGRAVQILLGSPAGLLLLVTGAVQGAGAEVVFAATRWRNYSLPVLMAAGVGAAIFSFAYTWVRFDYGALQPTILVAMFVLRCLSGALLGGLARPSHRRGALPAPAFCRALRSTMTMRSAHRLKLALAAEWRSVDVRYPFAERNAVGPVDLAAPAWRASAAARRVGLRQIVPATYADRPVPDSIPAEVTGRIEIFRTQANVRTAIRPNGRLSSRNISRTPTRPCAACGSRTRSRSRSKTGRCRTAEIEARVDRRRCSASACPMHGESVARCSFQAASDNWWRWRRRWRSMRRCSWPTNRQRILHPKRRGACTPY